MSISSSSPSRQSFYCFFFHFFIKNLNFTSFNEKSTCSSSEICFGYFEQNWKKLQATKSKLMEIQLQWTDDNKWLPKTRKCYLQQEGKQHPTQKDWFFFKYTQNNQKHHKTKIKFQTTKKTAELLGDWLLQHY